MPAYLGLFIDSLAPHFEQVVCLQHTPSAGQAAMMDYPIQSTNVELSSLGEHESIPRRMLRSRSTSAAVRRIRGMADVLVVRASTPLLPVLVRHWDGPIVLMLVSDATEGLENLPQPAWRKALIRLWAGWYARAERDAIRRHPTVVNSQMLYDKLRSVAGELCLLPTTTLREGDIVQREDTCGAGPIRLLFAGRITRIKGILDILEAMAALIAEGHDLVFDLVGMIDPGSGFLAEVESRAAGLGLAGRVRYIGYRTAGDELLREYRTADVFVSASQGSSEGFPRTMWEAMASGLPIVATAVSSVPMFTGGAAELAEPKNVGDLTARLRRVLTDAPRRREMIRMGRELARENTLERRGAELAERIKGWTGESAA